MRKTPKPSAREVSTLLELLRKGASGKSIELSSADLGSALGLSQQGASRRLLDLEQAGLVERKHAGRGLSVRLTDAGRVAIMDFYGRIRSAIEELPSSFVFRGRVFTGFGEGGYYVSMSGYAEQFLQKLGFRPFPGTLNVRLSDPAQIEQRSQLGSLKGIDLHGFSDRRRKMGPVKCFRAMVEGKSPGAVLAIERTHYDDSVLEVVSPVNLKKELKLSDGDECTVTAFLR